MKGVIFYGRDFLTMAEDDVLIKENISRILLTTPGERVNNPNFGSKLKFYLFELESMMREEVEGEIASSITRWEPRITIDSITTNLEDERTFFMKIEGTRVDTLSPFTFHQLIKL